MNAAVRYTPALTIRSFISQLGWRESDTYIAVTPTTAVNAPAIVLLQDGNAVPVLRSSMLHQDLLECLVRCFDLPAPLADADQQSTATEWRFVATLVIERADAFRNVEIAHYEYAKARSLENWEKVIEAEWQRFQLLDDFVYRPIHRDGFVELYELNSKLAEPLPFIQSYRHAWMSHAATFSSNLLDFTPWAKDTITNIIMLKNARHQQNEIEAEVINALDLHPVNLAPMRKLLERLKEEIGA